MNKQEMIKALEALPDDVIILPQVVAPDGSAWGMEARLSGIIDHFKWDHPVACLSLSHANLISLNPPKWKDQT